MQTQNPRFTRDKLAAVLAEVCAKAGLDATDAKLLRFTNNAVYSLVSAPVVVRIVGSETLRHRVAKVVGVAEHFARHDVPAVRLYPGIEQPVSAGEHVATLWWRVRERSARSSPGDLGRLLRQVHALPVPEGLPGWSPLTDVRARVADAEELDLADRRFLLDRCDETQAKLDALDFPLPPALVHGDAHLGNVLVGDDGPVLCDFDSSGVGPPEWDLMPVALGVLRFGDSMAVYEELADSYGFDVMAWGGFEVLQAARELKLTTSVLPILRSHPSVRPEFERRLTDLRAGDRTARWTRYR